MKAYLFVIKVINLYDRLEQNIYFLFKALGSVKEKGLNPKRKSILGL